MSSSVAASIFSTDEYSRYKIFCESIMNGRLELQYVPYKFLTAELYDLAVERNVHSLEVVSDKFKTELCLKEVKRNRHTLEFVLQCALPEDRQSLYLEAVKNGLALQHVPEEFKKQELCRIAVEKDWRALEFVPEELKDEKLCHIAVGKDWHAVEFVSEKLKTAELYIEAVNNGFELRHVPEKLRNEKLCHIAVKSNGLALQYVPNESKKQELCFDAVNNAGLALQYVPEGLKDEKLYRIAVGKDWRALEFVPEKTEEFCRIAVGKDWRALKFVPETIWAVELCFGAVKNGFAEPHDVPDALRDFLKNAKYGYHNKTLQKYCADLATHSPNFIPAFLRELYGIVVNEKCVETSSNDEESTDYRTVAWHAEKCRLNPSHIHSVPPNMLRDVQEFLGQSRSRRY